MDDGYEQTQALNFDDSGDETDEDNDQERPPVSTAFTIKDILKWGHGKSLMSSNCSKSGTVGSYNLSESKRCIWHIMCTLLFIFFFIF